MIHEKDLNNLDVYTNKVLLGEEIEGYFVSIERKYLYRKMKLNGGAQRMDIKRGYTLDGRGRCGWLRGFHI